MSAEDWDKTETFTIGAGDLFAAVMLCPEGGHWAWYVINDETGVLLASGSDDECSDAMENAETSLEKHDKCKHDRSGFCDKDDVQDDTRNCKYAMRAGKSVACEKAL